MARLYVELALRAVLVFVLAALVTFVLIDLWEKHFGWEQECYFTTDDGSTIHIRASGTEADLCERIREANTEEPS